MGRDTDEPQVMKLKRSLYGPIHSPNLCYGTINKSLLEVTSPQTKSYPCIYTHGSSDNLAILTLYVDDIFLTERHPAVLRRLKRDVMTWYPMTDQGEAEVVLGMTVTRDPKQGTPTISQVK